MNDRDRIVALESRIRRQGFALAGMGIGLALAVVMGMARQTPREMVLEALTITKDGVPRVMLGTNPEDGGVGIAFMDPKGKARVAIGTDVTGDGGLAVMDKNESPNILIGSDKDGAGIMLIGASLTELPAPPTPTAPERE